MRNNFPKKFIFTLIELLVVMAIIAILTSILLPALQMAKAQGYGILCKSNLKQCGSAHYSYGIDYNEFIPLNHSDSRWSAFMVDDYMLKKVRFCPSNPPSESAVNSYWTYGAYFRGQFYKINKINSFCWEKQSLSDNILLADTIYTHSSFFGYQVFIFEFGVSNYSIHTRHNHQSCCLMYDMHVISQSATQLSSPPNNFFRGLYPSVHP